MCKTLLRKMYFAKRDLTEFQLGLVERGPCVFWAKRYVGTFIYANLVNFEVYNIQEVARIARLAYMSMNIVRAGYVSWNEQKWLKYTARTPTSFHRPLPIQQKFYRWRCGCLLTVKLIKQVFHLKIVATQFFCRIFGIECLVVVFWLGFNVRILLFIL